MSKKSCQVVKKDGKACRAAAGESGFCFMHNPALWQERSLARRKGGLNRITPHSEATCVVPTQIRSVQDILQVLDYALFEALLLQNSVLRGRLLVSITYAYLETIKASEFEERLAAVEYAMKLRKVS